MESIHSIPLTKAKKLYTWAGVGAVALTALLTGYTTQFNVVEAIKVIPGIAGFIGADFLPPNVRAIPGFTASLLDTVYMAVISTLTGAVFSLLLSLLCAAPTAPHWTLKVGIRACASLLRNIPSLAWAIVLVPAFGIGKTVGVMALLINAVGNLTRFFTETVEEIDLGGVEAIRAAGGSYWQVLKSGVLPQCVPGLVSWTLYNLELDIRASTIIGMVGGGGIGFFIQSNIKLFRYDYATMAIIAVALSVLLIEYLTKKVRERMM
jgi:phosphonate transport system permease protein